MRSSGAVVDGCQPHRSASSGGAVDFRSALRHRTLPWAAQRRWSSNCACDAAAGAQIRAGEHRPAVPRALAARDRILGGFDLLSLAVEPDHPREHASLRPGYSLGLIFRGELVIARTFYGHGSQPPPVHRGIAAALLYQQVRARRGLSADPLHPEDRRDLGARCLRVPPIRGLVERAHHSEQQQGRSDCRHGAGLRRSSPIQGVRLSR